MFLFYAFSDVDSIDATPKFMYKIFTFVGFSRCFSNRKEIAFQMEHTRKGCYSYPTQLSEDGILLNSHLHHSVAVGSALLTNNVEMLTL